MIECNSTEYERIDFNKKCGICQPYLCNGCHDLIQKAMGFNDIAYKIHFWYMSKDDAINIMTNSNLVDKRGVL